MLFERTALSKKPDELIQHELNKLRAEDKLTPDLVFRDPARARLAQKEWLNGKRLLPQ